PPSWVERLCIEEAPPGADDGLVVQVIDGPEPRCDATVPIFLRISSSEAGGAVRVAGERKTARPALRARVRPIRIEERERVVFLGGRRGVVATQPGVHGERVVQS